MEYNSASKHASSNSLDSDSKSSSLNSKQGVDTMVISKFSHADLNHTENVIRIQECLICLLSLLL